MRNFFYKRNLALILAALVLGHNAQVHAISKKNAVGGWSWRYRSGWLPNLQSMRQE